MDDSTLNPVALQNAKDMFVLASHSDFSPTNQLMHNGLNLCRMLLHTVLVKTDYSQNSSYELVIDAHLILMWKVDSVKTIDYASFIISNMHFCSFPLRNNALPYANIWTLVFDHSNLLFDLEEVDYSGPHSLSLTMFSLPLAYSKLMVSTSYTHTYQYPRKRISKRSMERSL